jgi:hypothetical protein
MPRGVILRGLACAAIAAISITSLSPTAWGQVNVEPLREQIEESGFGARVRASVTTLAGNTRGVVFGGGGLLGFRSSRHLAYFDVAGDYTSMNSVVSVAKWFAHARHNYELARLLAWEVFGQLESDRFRRVQLRELLGTGPRFTLLDEEAFRLFYGTSYMYEHTRFDSAEAGSRGEGVSHRWNNYVSVSYRPDERILLSSVIYAQPRFDRFSNYHVLNVSSAGFTITERLQSRVDCTIRYESVHPPDVKGADLELKSALELVF